MKVTDWLDKRYEADGPGYLRVLGVITSPALFLRNPITGETKIVVIGCRNHKEMREISDKDVVSILEEMLPTPPRAGEPGE